MSDAALPAAWYELETATVSDALDRCGLGGQVWGLRALDGGRRAIGRAYTVRMLPVGAAGGTVGDYIDDVQAGAMVVIDNGGRTDCTVWGDLLTTVAVRRGLAGTVIHGACRDAARALALQYPLFSRGTYMRTGKDRVRAVDFQVPVSIGEVAVYPGDIVLGDADGVVVVPRELEDAVLSIACEIARQEETIRVEIESGSSLEDSRARYDYHSLQRSDDA